MLTRPPCSSPRAVAGLEELWSEIAALGFSEPAFAWAASQAWSRCFVHPASSELVLAPGIDLCNHSAAANAEVEFLSSKGGGQGAQADEDICGPAAAAAARQAGGPCIVLRAARDIPAGDEVTISYGSAKSNTEFYLLYGFLPERRA